MSPCRIDAFSCIEKKNTITLYIMKILKNKKGLSSLLGFCGLMVASIVGQGCGQGNVPGESFERSDYYTRGIGSYPGDPKEDFSPSLHPDYTTYRNIALLRSAYNSSSYDYNLTAQLATDGIISDQEPQYFVLSTQDGEIPRREREWMIDQGPYSRNSTVGEEAYFLFSLKNWKRKADKVQFRGNVAYEEGKVKGGYEIVCQGSNDGSTWTDLATLKGDGMPGKASRYKAHSDPNKNSWDPGTLPVRALNITLPFERTGEYAYYRMFMRMKGAAYWTFYEVNFYDQDQLVDLLPSQYFNSAWMSATAGEEWLYVDLGSSSTFDKVRLNWINKAVKGKIQVSDDASQWTDVAELPGGTALVDEVDVKGKGRYVRVLMTESANQGRYILSEIEVMGKGGLVARPVASPASTEDEIRLSGGDWKLQRASLVEASGEEISTPAFRPEGWLVATVPGTVLSSYKNAGAIPNPNYADNMLQISESFFNSNFWYRDEFEVPEGFKRERLFLNFDGINWKANVYLNGKRVGRIDGAFIRGMFDVTDAVVPGKNVLAVEIIKNAHIGAVKEKYAKNTDFNGGVLGADNPTFHATVGWDWISTTRGRNIGIWNDVYLTSKGNVTVQDPFVQVALPLPDTTSARLTPEVIVKNHASAPVKGTLTGRIGSVSFERPVELAANEVRTVVFDPADFEQLNVRNPRLWWPRGYGFPYLYDANFTFKVNDEVSDSEDFKVGIRQMNFTNENNILSLYINGRRFVGRGGNWGFGESNLNYRGREYDAAVAYHADMNFTMLRNWVGQIGDRELYEACDRYGVMLWQDFWLANPSDGPDPYDPEMFVANAEDMVNRVRQHASIAIYCGRNEGYPPERLDTALRRIVKEEHPGLLYISSSADDGVSGHGPYQARPVKEYFTMKNGSDQFHSERGMPNVMNYESLVRTFSPDALWPQNDQWGQHDYTMEGAQSCASFNALIEEGFGKPTSAKEFADLAQWINYNGYRALFESRSLNRKGLLLWMTHPAWPSMVWQTYDYYFEPTAAYFGCKKACEPLHIQWNPATDKVEVVNYSAGTRPGLKAKAQIVNMDASVAWEKEVSVDSREDTTEGCISLEYPANVSAAHFIKLTLTENGQVVSENFYVRGVEEGNYQALRSLPKVALRSDVTSRKGEDGTWTATATLENTSDVPALLIRVNVVGERDGDQFLPIFYGDNYFSLLPGEKKTVDIRWKDVDTRGQAPKVVVSGYNVEKSES